MAWETKSAQFNSKDNTNSLMFFPVKNNRNFLISKGVEFGPFKYQSILAFFTYKPFPPIRRVFPFLQVLRYPGGNRCRRGL